TNLRTLCKDCHNKRHHRMNYRSNHERKENRWSKDERWD
ncbi:MAG: HNH endonuclease, partial [Lactiplantibacillus plantarum]